MSKDERTAFVSLVLRRLSGLLSGCPPTDTRPQARAKLGTQRNKPNRPRVNSVARMSGAVVATPLRLQRYAGQRSRISRRAVGAALTPTLQARAPLHQHVPKLPRI